MQTSNDFGLDVSIDKALRGLRMLSEDIQHSFTSDITNERDRSVRNVINLRQSEFWGGEYLPLFFITFLPIIVNLQWYFEMKSSRCYTHPPF